MNVGDVRRNEHGLWHVSVFPGRADVLLSALNPEAAFVLIETWDGRRGWHETVVSLDEGEQPRPRLVRHHRFDLLVDPTEAVEIGRLLHARGLADGGLGCYQFRERPSADFSLPDYPRGRADALRGQGVEVAIDLPHDGELALISAPRETALRDYVLTLRSLTEPDADGGAD